MSQVAHRTLLVKIAGVDRTSMVQCDTLEFSDDLDNRSTCGFTLEDATGTYEPWIGASIEVFDGSPDVFNGTIDDVVKGSNPLAGKQYFDISCVDKSQLADKRLVATSYSSLTAGEIVKQIVSEWMAGDGVTVNHVQDGPMVEKVVFNYQPASRCFDDLCNLTGFKWFIDADKDLWFYERKTYDAPWGLTDTSNNFSGFKIRRTRERYRNKQYVRGARSETSPRTEAFVGDGAQKTFTLAYEVSEVDIITVNGAAQVIGVVGTPGCDWFYEKGSRTISQADGNTALTATDLLAVSYIGFFPIVAVVTHSSEVASRASVEGGSGLYEDVEIDESIESQVQAQQLASAQVKLYGKLPRLIEFRTESPGLKAGMMIPIKLSRFNLNDKFLVYSVKGRDVKGCWLEYSVSCVGSEPPNWLSFFKGMTKRSNQLSLRANEVVVAIRLQVESAPAGDVLSVSAGGPESRAGYMKAGFGIAALQ